MIIIIAIPALIKLLFDEDVLLEVDGEVYWDELLVVIVVDEEVTEYVVDVD